MTEISISTLRKKGNRVKEELHTEQLDPEFTHRRLQEEMMVSWLIEYNGFLVDARELPDDMFREAIDQGLVPGPAENERNGKEII